MGDAKVQIPATGPGSAHATSIVFFSIGFVSGAWAPLIPFVKARLQLDDAGLGLVLLCLGAGSVVAMPPAGALATRLGCRRVLTAAGMACAGCFLLMALAPSPALLAAALFAFGAALGSLDCVVNIHAIAVERDAARPMMSGFHGLYSLGGAAGAGAASGLVALGATPVLTAALTAGLVVAATLAAHPRLLSRPAAGRGPLFALPHGVVVLIGVGCLIVFLAEGSVLDWSAVFLRTQRGAGPAQAGLAYAAFSVTMTAGRLIGDRLVARVGHPAILLMGSLAAAAGLTIAASAPGWPAAVAGYAVVGAGCSNIVPVLFTLTGRQSVMPEPQAVAAVSVLGYAGLLAGPAAIGFLAHAYGLPQALLAVAALLLLVAAAAPRLGTRP
jgi:MFS family permease